MNLLPDRLPWYVAGPALGLLLVASYAIANRPLSGSGTYFHVLSFVRKQATAEVWRVWFFVGLIAGALFAAVLRGGPSFGLEYGALGRVLPLAALVPVLFVGGILIGYGARWAGGCTSGHGISGSAALSPASIVATLTFMATAIGLTMLLNVLTGGAL